MQRWWDRAYSAFLRLFLRTVGGLVARMIFKVTVVGAENLPASEPVIVISNHFSWFDGALLTFHLPFRTSYMVAVEAQRFWPVQLYMRAFDGISVWRGQADRKALRTALDRLKQGRSIGIFPEGGIDPELADQRARGELIQESLSQDYSSHAARRDAQLTAPQPGVAYLAVKSGAPILPVALIGTEKVIENIRRWRRTPVIIRIGPVFGPLTIEDGISKQERRQRLDAAAEELMFHLVVLFPPTYQGIYRDRILGRS